MDGVIGYYFTTDKIRWERKTASHYRTLHLWGYECNLDVWELGERVASALRKENEDE